MDEEFIILEEASKAFERFDIAKRELQKMEAEIKSLCTRYSVAMKIWGYRPEMLRHAVEARMGRRKVV